MDTHNPRPRSGGVGSSCIDSAASTSVAGYWRFQNLIWLGGSRRSKMGFGAYRSNIAAATTSSRRKNMKTDTRNLVVATRIDVFQAGMGDGRF